MLSSLRDEQNHEESSPILITAIDIIDSGPASLTTGFERKDFELMEGDTEICFEDETTPKACFIVVNDGTSH